MPYNALLKMTSTWQTFDLAASQNMLQKDPSTALSPEKWEEIIAGAYKRSGCLNCEKRPTLQGKSARILRRRPQCRAGAQQAEFSHHYFPSLDDEAMLVTGTIPQSGASTVTNVEPAPSSLLASHVRGSVWRARLGGHGPFRGNCRF